jgi:hypothetical protein
MSIRVQVILDDEDATRFKSQAKRESKSLSAWLREAGRKMLEENQNRNSLTDPQSLRLFFEECNAREKGKEPDWEEQKELILEGYTAGRRL